MFAEKERKIPEKFKFVLCKPSETLLFGHFHDIMKFMLINMSRQEDKLEFGSFYELTIDS